MLLLIAVVWESLYIIISESIIIHWWNLVLKTCECIQIPAPKFE